MIVFKNVTVSKNIVYFCLILFNLPTLSFYTFSHFFFFFFTAIKNKRKYASVQFFFLQLLKFNEIVYIIKTK